MFQIFSVKRQKYKRNEYQDLTPKVENKKCTQFSCSKLSTDIVIVM